MAAMKRPAQSGSVETLTKKARISEVDHALKSVVEAFESDDQIGVSSIPATCITMLKTLVPGSLSVPASQRHAFQSQIAASVREVLAEIVGINESTWQEYTSVVESATALKAEKAEALAVAKKAVDACLEDVKVKRSALEGAKDDMTAAAGVLSDAEHAVTTCEKQKGIKEKAKMKCTTLVTENFNVLKAGAWDSAEAQAKGEKKLMGPLVTQLTRLKADVSLLEGISTALALSPDARGEFDHFVVQSAEEQFTAHLKELDDWLANFEPTLEEKNAVVASCKTELEFAEITHGVCEEFLKETEDALAASKSSVKEANQILGEHDSNVKKAAFEERLKLKALETSRKNLEAFAFLNDRVEAPEAPEEADAAAEPSAGDELMA